MSDFYGDYRDVEVLRQDVQQKYRIIKDLNSRLAEAERLRDHYKERIKELEIRNGSLMVKLNLLRLKISYLEGQNEALRLALGRE